MASYNPPFTVSINPSYLCNFRCTFCYLTPEQLSNRLKIDLEILHDKLLEISTYRTITHIDLYGGELTALPENYVNALLDCIEDVYGGTVSIITNLSRLPDWLYRPELDISVSWDYIEREQHKRVLGNMARFNKPFHVLMLATKQMIYWDSDILIDAVNICNTLTNIRTVEIKPYSSNQANDHDVSFMDYEMFVQRWMLYSPKKSRSYEFVTENKIIDVLNGHGYSMSDDHIYITPEGQFAVLDFDAQNREFFSIKENFLEYIKWTQDEEYMINMSKYCYACEFNKKCLSEHLRLVTTDPADTSCSGFKRLLKWYRNTN